MKKVIASTILGLGIVSLMACSNESEPPKEEKPAEQTVVSDKPADTIFSVTGKITKIENGKDGYMATVQDEKNKNYIATISIVNLQEGGSTYKKHNVGDTISVKGSGWQDNEGNTYITVKQLN